MFGEENNYINYRNEVQEYLDKNLVKFSIILIIIFTVFWIFSYFFIYVLAKNIVKPLAKLSHLAKSINKSEEKNNATEDIKE